MRLFSGSDDYPDRTPEQIKADLERQKKDKQKFNAFMLVKDLMEPEYSNGWPVEICKLVVISDPGDEQESIKELI